MRGKISYYNEKTHVGMVVDKARMVYEFKSAIWYDQHRLPTTDMYVDFKANELGKIEQIKESSLLKLQRKYDVTENDFWQSVDEEALEDLAVARREKLLTDRILFMSPAPISEDYTMSDCFLAFFADSVELVYKYEELAFAEGAEHEQIDYFKLKRFMHKAKSQLVRSDGSISVEPFNKMEKELTELEFVTLEAIKQKSRPMQALFEDIYLVQQVGYLRAERRVKIDTQRAFELNLSIKRTNENIIMWRNRLAKEQNQDTIAAMGRKIDSLLAARANAAGELQRIEESKPFFATHVKNFKDAKFEEFTNSFGFESELKGITDALKKTMNRIAFNYDTLLWEKAVNSYIILGTFFRQATEGNFCSPTFLRYYLKPLNKRTLSKSDEALYNYLIKYDRTIAKHVLLLSENKAVMEQIAMAVYANIKDSVVHRFSRAVDSLHHIRRNKAALAVFDEQNRTLLPEELAQNYGEAHPWEKLCILVFNSRKASTAKPSENIEVIKMVGYDEGALAEKIVYLLMGLDDVYIDNIEPSFE